MESSFWSGYTIPNFLFYNVEITSSKEILAVCLITAVVAFFYEATRTLRDWLFLKFLTKRRSGEVSSPSGTIWMDDVKSQPKVEGESTGKPVMAAGTSLTKKRSEPKSGAGLLELLASTVLHMCQVGIGYMLMLAVMTFNVWIFIAVLIGVGIGFFMFDGFNKRIHAQKLAQ